MDNPELEREALVPESVAEAGINSSAELPYGLEAAHVGQAMQDFVEFLGFINEQLATRDIERLESMLMPANFSSMVGEFMHGAIPKHCPGVVKNLYHNGHPDLIPTGRFPDDAVQHADEGIEVKASRYLRGWQGHNPEDTFLMVFMFDSNRPVDPLKGIQPKPFRFLRVAAAQLDYDDWKFSGRSETSRRTITAAVRPSGFEKMMANCVYEAPKGAGGGFSGSQQPLIP